MSWRPDDWRQPSGIGDKTPPMAYEAGADAMHLSDIEWLRDKHWTVEDGGTSIYIRNEDWQEFIKEG